MSTAFDVLAASVIICYAVVYIAHTKGKGVCKSESERLSIEEYDKVILCGILQSKTYKFRSKCHGYWYKCYLNFQLLSTFKVLISTYLNVYALIEVKPDVEGSNTQFYTAVVWGYLFGLGVLFYRIHRLVLHYPFLCAANMNHESFNKILPFLVWNVQTGALSSVCVEFTNTIVGFVVIRQNPTTSITSMVIIAISISLIFAIKNAYSQCKFFWRARKCVYGFDFGDNEARYNDLVRLKKMYFDVHVDSGRECGARYIIAAFWFVLWMILCLIVFAICTLCSLRSYYDICGIFPSEVWIWCTIIDLLVFPFAPIMARYGFYLNVNSRIARLWFFISWILTIIFGAIYVGKNGVDENIEIYVVAILLIIIGSCCFCGFCLMCYFEIHHTNDANDVLLPMHASDLYQTHTNKNEETIKMSNAMIEILKQMEESK